jgi:predicted acyltransferase
LSKQSQGKKLKILAISSGGVLALGYLVSIFVPVVMKMWTVSYGLISAGWAGSTLLLFYWLNDVMGYKKWAFPFVVIGMNALAVYLSSTVMRLSTIADVFTGGIAEALGKAGPSFAALAFLALEWAILNWMYKRKIFLSP